MPIGPWPIDPHQKEIGAFAQVVLTQDPEGWMQFMANTLGWERKQIESYAAAVKRESRSNKYHPYYMQMVVWGRKPVAC